MVNPYRQKTSKIINRNLGFHHYLGKTESSLVRIILSHVEYTIKNVPEVPPLF